jgi:hypothetical protein
VRIIGIIGGRLAWTASMISALSIPSEVDRRDAEAGVPEPALDDDQRHALARHLYGVRVTKVVRREAAPHACWAATSRSCARGGV